MLKRPQYIISALGLIAILMLVFFPQEENLKQSAIQLNDHIHLQETSFKSFVAENFIPISNSSLSKEKKLKNLGFELFYYTNDSLLFYTSNKVLLDLPPSIYTDQVSIIQLHNGWYLFQKEEKNKQTIIGLTLLQNQYKIENVFLSNSEQINEISLDGIQLSDKYSEGAIKLTNIAGQPIGSLYIDINSHTTKTPITKLLSSWILILIALYLLWWLGSEVAKKGHTISALLIMSMLLLSLRVLLIILELPLGGSYSSLFDPTIFASSFFSKSLGQLIISLGFFSVFVFFGQKYFPVFKNKTEEKIGNLFYAILHGYSLFLVLWLFKALVLDSQISLELYDVLSLSFYSIIGLLAVLMTLFLHWIILRNRIRLFQSKQGLALYVTISYITLFVFSILLFDHQEVEIVLIGSIWLGVYLFISYYTQAKSLTLFEWKTIVVHLVMASLLSMFLLENLYENKERQQRLYFANKLVEGHNYIAEYGFSQVSKLLKTDQSIQNYIQRNDIPYKELKDRLAVLYFRDHFQNYNFDVFFYDAKGEPIKIEDTLTETHVRERIHQLNTQGDTLLFLEDSIFTSGYLGYISLGKDSISQSYIGILFVPKLYNAQTVYPELLASKQFSNKLPQTNYSYAVYLDDKLSFQSGNFPYDYYLDEQFANSTSKINFFETNEWEHLLIKNSGLKKVIVSIPQEGFFEPLATFSYFFILSIFFTLIIWLFRQYILQKKQPLEDDFIKVSFRTKLHLALLSLVGLSFVVIGIVTISFIKRQYDSYYTDRFSKKVKSILTGIEYAIQNQHEAYNLNGDLIRIETSKLSEINGIDINLYDAQGWLIQSTRPEIFQEGLVSKKIAPIAFDELALKQSNQFVNVESIGTLEYYSFYIPLRNKQRVTLGYLNIPYFEKSNDINKEVSSFLVTLMNVYAFLLLCAGIFSFFISNSITRPLRFIGEKIRRINLKKTNEPILWNSNDEIGRLIREYNKMIIELEGSAKDLARSERESAWRQMARQIAHEIKNPLTPMKLSIQYLQRAIDENNPNVAELAKKVNRTLIEQIDNLSSIATAFSSFAQMPKPNNEYINLNQVLSDIVSLFEKETSNKITFNSYFENAVVLADRNQLISVFNNLIKNAIQSLEESDNGQIDVIVLEEYGEIKVVVMDNGKGIPESQYDKVFVPNFTTKSSGTGLGLAISKQIVDLSRGNIWFESEVNVGTKFYVSLPHQDDTN